jgi:two-component system response regulator MprA
MEATARVAVIDDEAAIRLVLESELREAGFEVRAAGDAPAGLELVKEWEPDLILLDVMMPKIDGISALPAFRSLTQAPIVVLSARGGTDDKVLGLERGADQYIAKPFEIPELVARLKSALRRPRLDKPELLTFQDLVLDLRHRAVRRNGREIALTTREFDLLETFMRQPRRVFTKDQLITLVWGEDAEVSTNAVETYVSYLRTKIDAAGSGSLIATIRGVGYSLRTTAR